MIRILPQPAPSTLSLLLLFATLHHQPLSLSLGSPLSLSRYYSILRPLSFLKKVLPPPPAEPLKIWDIVKGWRQ